MLNALTSKLSGLPVFHVHIVVKATIAGWAAAQEAPVVELQGFPEYVGAGVPIYLQSDRGQAAAASWEVTRLMQGRVSMWVQHQVTDTRTQAVSSLQTAETCLFLSPPWSPLCSHPILCPTSQLCASPAGSLWAALGPAPKPLPSGPQPWAEESCTMSRAAAQSWFRPSAESRLWVWALAPFLLLLLLWPAFLSQRCGHSGCSWHRSR